ncbi:N-acetylmuramoyl-L-alanine amidase [Acidipila sp. EB88]|uniref:N-acetylmuramoyl-L-alanine amidase n=1 Tax=Acidipila sp. EB88 TaxID=2305226 RepID=UPI000F5F5911|nr:N-acetylmuramoyl-L-alanine amidase [Acidipila sp. EB88]RRA47895.1 AMIN domain-containing protein [Acidipila sp. EB88]
MPPGFRQAVRSATLLFAAVLPWQGEPQAQQAPPSAHATYPSDYSNALHLRQQLDATPRASRTSRQYTRALDAFRAVYHADRADPDADASAEAVAELLAEQGRLFNDPGLLHAAVDQLDFLRRDFAASRFSVPALLTAGEIETRDLHDDAAARKLFLSFLQSYPRSELAPQARFELQRLGGTSPPTMRSLAGQTGQSAPSNTARQGAPGYAQAPSSAPTVVDATGGDDDTDDNSVVAPPTTRPAGKPAPLARAPGPVSVTAPNTALSTAAPIQPPTATRVIQGVPVYRPTAAPVKGKLSLVTGVRHWSTADYTRIAIDVQDETPFEASRVSGPDRIFFDLHGARLASDLAGKAVTVTDGGFLERIRAAQFSGDVVRVVLDVSDVSDYSAFWLPNPSRLIIDIHGRPKGAPPPVFANAAPAPQPAAGAGTGTAAAGMLAQATPATQGTPPPAGSRNRTGSSGGTQQGIPVEMPQPHTPASRAAANGAPAPSAARAGAPGTFVAETVPPGAPASTQKPRAGDSLAAIAALSQQPTRVRATRQPTTAPVAAIATPPAPAHAADRDPDLAPIPSEAPATSPLSAHVDVPASPAPAAPRRRGKRSTTPDASDPSTGAPSSAVTTNAASARAAEPDSMGGRSMVRALGLKINRIVVDAGHGGHDSGTLGPGGIEEKDVVLDVALRLGKLLKQGLGADVIYTRDDDTFIPLETRTAIANKAQADLFISVHANSSSDPGARGVETYYLNFTTSADALEVAARENAVSDESIHQLSDLVKKITLQDKIAESREFATDVEGTLYQGLTSGNAGLKDRGVKKAPFVVLIGANMPSILAEISFLTNPDDAVQLREGAYRQRIAESLYRGVARYVRSLSGIRQQDTAAASGTR